jgi:hypothetical protein
MDVLLQLLGLGGRLGAIVSGIKRLDPIEQREAFVLSNKNVQVWEDCCDVGIAPFEVSA